MLELVLDFPTPVIVWAVASFFPLTCQLSEHVDIQYTLVSTQERWGKLPSMLFCFPSGVVFTSEIKVTPSNSLHFHKEKCSLTSLET